MKPVAHELNDSGLRVSRINAVAVEMPSDTMPHLPGEFVWLETDGKIVGMHFACPCGCDAIHGAHFGEGKWQWDGNKESPTVTPSLGLSASGNGAIAPDGSGYHWHGFLRNGYFEEC